MFEGSVKEAAERRRSLQELEKFAHRAKQLRNIDILMFGGDGP
jgi:hypothetical protein